MGGSGMGKLTEFDKHVILIECNGPKNAADAAKFTEELHKLLQRFGATVTFDMTGAKGGA